MRNGWTSVVVVAIATVAGGLAAGAAEPGAAAVVVAQAGKTATPQTGAGSTTAPLDAIRALFADPAAIGAEHLSYDELTTDPASGVTEITGIDARWHIEGGEEMGEPFRADLVLALPRLRLTNLAREGEFFHADRVSAAAMTMSLDVAGSQAMRYDWAVTGYETVDMRWAPLPKVTIDPERPFSSYAPYLEWTLTFSQESARIGPSVGTIEAPEMTQMTRQGPIEIGRLSAGRLESYRQGESVTTARAENMPEAGNIGEMTFTVGAQHGEGIDLAPLVRFLVGPGADGGPYETVVEHLEADGMSFATDVMSFHMGEIGYDGFRMKPIPEPLFAFLDQVATSGVPADETQMFVRLVRFYGAFAIDSAVARNLAVEVPDQGGGKLEEMRFENLSSDGLGRFGIGGVTIDAPGTKLDLDTFAVADLSFPTLEALLALEHVEETKDVTAAARAMPKLGLLLVEGFRFANTVVKGTMRLDTLRFEQGGFLPVPTHLLLEMKGLSVPLGYVDDPDARSRLEALGADPFEAELRFATDWTEATKALVIGPLDVTIGAVGRLRFEMDLDGVPRTVFENPNAVQAALATLAFRSTEAFFVDEGLTAFTLRTIAEQTGQTVEQAAAMIADQAEAQLVAILPDLDLAQRTAASIRRFLQDPKTIRFTATPKVPVPVAQILGTAAMAPKTLPALLDVRLDVNVAP